MRYMPDPPLADSEDSSPLVPCTCRACMQVVDLSADFRLRDPKEYAEW